MTGAGLDTARRRLIFIAGWGRSGSTMVANVLSATAGGLSLGEVRYLWDRGLIENRLCGCGTGVRDCAFWQAVCTESAGTTGPPDPRHMSARVGADAIWSQLAALMLGRINAYQRARTSEIGALRAVYSAAFAVSGVNVVVDASKSAPYLINLLGADDVEICVLHLVRDPRAVAYSWMRRKSTEESDEHAWFPRYSAWRSAISWTLHDVAAGRLARHSGVRYLRMKYEDFCDNPRARVTEILNAFDIEPRECAWIDDHHFGLQAQHSISGNPNRFRTGPVPIRNDDEWQSRMPQASRRLVELACGALMRRYGYAATGVPDAPAPGPT